MRLEVGTHHVGDAVFGPETQLKDGTLTINRDALRRHLLEGSLFADIEIDIARPGESVRIVHALDAVEPRLKDSGPEALFPGVTGPVEQAGQGRADRLAGVAVMGVAEPLAGEEYWYAREAVIDMSGPGAAYSPFSKVINIVLTFVPKPAGEKLDPVDRLNFVVDTKTEEASALMESTRGLCYKAASFIAESVKGKTPDGSRVYELTPVDEELPKVAYVMQSMGAAVYGSMDPSESSGRLLHPNEVLDGAMTGSLFWLGANWRSAAYMYQNNALIEELYQRHGRDLDFRGVILFNGFGYTLEEKQAEADAVVESARRLGVDGAVVAPLSDGHPSVGHMLTIRACEEAGISTALAAAEMTASRGDPGFTYWVPEADAIVNPGDINLNVDLPAVDRVIGGSRILNSDVPAAGPIELDVRKLYGATGPMGNTQLIGRLY